MKDPNKTYINWGGARPNGGRPQKEYKKISVTISSEAYEIYRKQNEKGAFISSLILNSKNI